MGCNAGSSSSVVRVSDGNSQRATVRMRVAVVCDIGGDAGVGHASRCLAVAEQLSRHNTRLAWFTDLQAVPWFHREVMQLPGEFFAPESSREALEGQVVAWKPDVVLVDSYLLPTSFGAELMNRGIPVVAIVDPATPYRRCSLRWFPGFMDTVKDSREPATRGGPDCILLRSEIRQIANSQVAGRPSHGPLGEVGVLMGGTSGKDLTELVVNAFATESLNVRVHVNTPVSRSLEASVAVVEHERNADFWRVLMGCDLVITAAGVSAWESVHLGIPTGLLMTATNQAENYWGMTARGWTLGMGTSSELEQSSRFLVEGVSNGLSAWERSQAQAAAAKLAVDGRGAERLAEAMRSLHTSNTLPR